LHRRRAARALAAVRRETPPAPPPTRQKRAVGAPEPAGSRFRRIAQRARRDACVAKPTKRGTLGRRVASGARSVRAARAGAIRSAGGGGVLAANGRQREAARGAERRTAPTTRPDFLSRTENGERGTLPRDGMSRVRGETRAKRAAQLSENCVGRRRRRSASSHPGLIPTTGNASNHHALARLFMAADAVFRRAERSRPECAASRLRRRR
jgi:hypothetical protein